MDGGYLVMYHFFDRKIQTRTMKDIKGFCKMFDMNIPCDDEFEYYKSQFVRLDRWKEIDRFVTMYEKAEEEIGDLFTYRMAKIDEIVAFIEGTRAYQGLCDENLLPDYPTTKNYEYEEGKIYLSFDLKKANWQSVKWHDPSFVNELGDEYEGILERFGLPEVFWHSKHLRQYIFGFLNPKKQMKMQRVILEHVISAISPFGLKIEFVKHDEVCYSISSHRDAAVLLDICGSTLVPNAGLIREISRAPFPKIEVSAKIFRVMKVEDFRINQHICMESGEVLHSEPVGCDGHRFFMALKKHVFDEPYDIRDLYFRMDGRLAVWKTEKLKLELNS